MKINAVYNEFRQISQVVRNWQMYCTIHGNVNVSKKDKGNIQGRYKCFQIKDKGNIQGRYK